MAQTIKVRFGYAYLTTVTPDTTGNPAYYKIDSVTGANSSTADTVRVTVTSLKHGYDKTLTLEIQTPQTSGDTAPKDRRIKEYKKWNETIQIQGFIEYEYDPEDYTATTANNPSTRLQKRDSLINLFKNGRNQKGSSVFNLVVPDEMLTDGTSNASAITTITGVIKKVNIDEGASDKLNKRFSINFIFIQGTDL